MSDYPTAWAYEQACAALLRTKVERDRFREALKRIAEARDLDGGFLLRQVARDALNPTGMGTVKELLDPDHAGRRSATPSDEQASPGAARIAPMDRPSADTRKGPRDE